MYFVLTDHIALRSWKALRGAFYVKGRPHASGVTAEEFEILKLCDGEHDIDDDRITQSLIRKHLIRPCEKGEHPSDWSAYRRYDNRYFPKMNLMITGKCNYNCLHCFNAADNAPLMAEWKYEEILDLLDQAKDCGINAFTITGGEPTLHPQFMDIIRAIYERDMYVDALNTNGSLIDQKMLDEFKAIGCNPQIKISFDGLGSHDWMRGRKGAEEKTLKAMELCVDNDFQVMSQTQVHRHNLEALMDTARRLDDLGVGILRLIRTTEAPRWIQNAGDSCLPIEEYYGKMLDFAGSYKDSGMKMDVIIWQFMKLHPSRRIYSLETVRCNDGNFRSSAPVCSGNRGMVGVTCEGELVPCMQMSGFMKQRGIHMGNLHEMPLKKALTDGAYIEAVCLDLREKLEDNQKCAACRYFKYCAGGCPALGLNYCGSLTGSDLSKCMFFENDWYQKIVARMDGWSNLTQIKKLEEL